MLAYVVERVYQDQRPSSVMSVFSSPERAQAWVERQQYAHADDSFVHVRVIEVDVSAAAAS
jgi:hypothetical protein